MAAHSPSPPVAAGKPVAAGETVGLLAAWGRFPFEVADAMRSGGLRVCCLGVRGHAQPELRDAADEFHWIGAARLGDAIRRFRRAGVVHATMAGKFHKVDLYRPWAWSRYVPDWTSLETFYPHFIGRQADRKDDTLLMAFVDAFARRGITMGPATDYAPELLVPEGTIAGRPPTADQRADIAFGWELAKQMGGLDVGQSVCVRGRAALAIEAIEGTDACIQRAGQLCPRGGFTVVKVAKPQQDMRFDVPTVGAGTLRTMAAAGAKVLAIEASRTIVLDREAFRREARRCGVSVLAIQDPATLGSQAA